MTLIKQAIDNLDRGRLWEYRLPRVAATEEELRDVEKALGEPLDPAYRRFLSFAGGWPAFYQMVDLFGPEELLEGPRRRAAAERLSHVETSVLNAADVRRDELLPIGVSRDDLDLFVIARRSAKTPGEVIWLAGDLIDRYPTFDEYFLAMMDYNRRELERLRATTSDEGGSGRGSGSGLGPVLPMTGVEEFVEVVEPLPFAEADRRFAEWLDEQVLRRGELPDDDVRIDTIRGLGGQSLRRYMVRRKFLDRRP